MGAVCYVEKACYGERLEIMGLEKRREKKRPVRGTGHLAGAISTPLHTHIAHTRIAIPGGWFPLFH